MAKGKRKPDPTKICARMHKGWAFLGSMTVEQYRDKEEEVRLDLERLSIEEFTVKYQNWMW